MSTVGTGLGKPNPILSRLWVTLLLLAPLAAVGQTIVYSYADLVGRLTNLEYLATLPAVGDQCALGSSYDRSSYYDTNTGQYINWSANNDCCGIIRTEGTSQVLAEMQGPGCIWRIWSATPSSGHVRIYLDGTNGPPVVDLPFSAYFDGVHAPFTNSALVHTTAANGWNNYTPIPYQKSCKIVADSTWGSYYQFTYETFPTNTQVPTFTPQLSAADAAALAGANQALAHPGADPAGSRPGQNTLINTVALTGGSTQLVAQLTGPAALTALRVKLSLPPSPQDYDLLRTLALQIKWDGEANPSVWAPLGDFFGTAPGGNQYASLPLGHTADGWWYCYWYMPFATGARVELVNDGSVDQSVTCQLTTAPLSRPLASLTRFHAKWHRDAFLPSDPNRAIDWTLLTSTGAGRYVGTMLHIWNPQGGWWGEGDDKFFVDGEPFPSSFGTGSEDYFGYAWSSPVLFQHALHNQTHNDGGSKGHLSVNRWHVADAVPFQQSMQAYIEKYFANPRPTLYAAMVYWYLASGGQDPYTPVPLANRIDYWTPLVIYRAPGAIEGETMTVSSLSGGTAQSQDMSSFSGTWSANAQLWWTGAQPGNTLTLALPVTNAGVYKLSVALTKAPDYGIVQLYLDGQALGQAVDLYNSTVIPTGPLLMGSFSLSAGQHALGVRIVGANPAATPSYMFGLDYVKLEPPVALLDALNLGNPAGDVAVVFTAPVSAQTATNRANYSFNNGVTVLDARMGASPDTVLLQTTGLTVGSVYTLTANNVQDLSVPPNTIAPNNALTLEQNLHTWLPMDEATGTTLGDASGQNRAATLVNGALPGYSGKVLRAVQFDGAAGYARAQTSSSEFSTNGLTVALWANPSNLASWSRFMDYGNGAGSDNILFARNGSSADLTFEVYSSGSSGGKVTASGALAVGQWQHLAATMDPAGQVILYRNGVALVTNSTAVPAPVTRTSNFLGRSNWPQDSYYQGKLDDFRLYTRPLSPAAILALASGGGPDDSSPSIPPVSVVATVPTTALNNASPGVFTLTRAGNLSAPLTVFYALGGTAGNGIDYAMLSGSAVIPVGTNATQVLVSPLDHAFVDPQRTVVLTVLGSTNYTLADANSATVIIQNNELAPAAMLATADNALAGTNATTVDVWFSLPVSNPSATALGNYTLINAPGVTITNASLSATNNLRVVLRLSGPVPATAQVSVHGVQDGSGNSASNQVPIRPRLAPVNVLANLYHGATTTRSVAFGYVTDGVVNNTNNSPAFGNTGFDTYGGSANAVLTQFGGLLYSSSQEFQVIKVDLGKQFGDGGDWQAPPSVYILQNPVDTGSIRPESDAGDWVQVSAQRISGGQFQAGAWTAPGPSPNTPYVFDLTHLAPAARTGWGWAVGGALGNGANGFLSFSELRAYGLSGTSNSILITQQPQDRTVTRGQRTTFVQFSTNIMLLPLAYQWQRNGTNIPGATDVNYSIPPATLTDNGATFDVVVSTIPGTGNSVTSQVATLTVLDRTTPPSLVVANLDTTNRLIDLWFDEAVDGITGQNTGNYTLNDPVLRLVSATTNANGYCVTLSYGGTPSVPNLTVTVIGVQDFFGHTLGSQTTAVLPLCWPVVNVVANVYQQERVTASMDSTNGIIINATGDTNVWETWEGAMSPTTTDFVGLRYDQPQVFGVIKMDLGWQFPDGGDWELQPYVYLLKNPIDTNQRYPESDPLDWVAVPATLISGNVFNYAVDGPVGVPVNTPIAFDLSHLPLSQRTGYGWAVGGVPANAAAHFLSLTELRAFGSAAVNYTNLSGPPQVLLDVPASLAQPAGLPLTLTVYATGTQPITYQWKRNGVNLVDGGLVSGAHTSVLTLAEAFASDAGTYQLAMTNSAGVGLSTACVVSLTRNQPNAGYNWSLNGVNGNTTWVPTVNGSGLTLTDGLNNERSSVFLNYPQYIGAFAASFTYQDVGGGGADGMAFVLQNDPRGPLALGGGGGGLGYSGITPSVAQQFNLYGPNAPSSTSSGMAFRVNGMTGTPYADCTPVNPASGNPIAVSLRYDGTTASVVLNDTVSGGVFTTNYLVDLPTLLGGTNTAYVGFTGADGGAASHQQISNFYFASIPRLSVSGVSPGVLQLSWPASAGGVVLQQTPSLSAPNWTTVNAPVTLVNGQNQVQVSTLTGTQCYRLGLP